MPAVTWPIRASLRVSEPFVPTLNFASMISRYTVGLHHFGLGALLVLLAFTGCAPREKAGQANLRAAADTVSDSVLAEKLENSRYEGNPRAPIWIVMVSDFQCPYCKVWHDSTLAAVRRDYVATGRARLAYLNLPLQMHSHARVMASAALCAGAQDKFWPFADSLFSKQATIAKLPDAEPEIQAASHALQLDSNAFAHCRASHVVNSVIASDMRQAAQAQIQSTPSFFVGQFLLQGAVPYPGFKRAVDSALVVAAQKH